MFYCARCKHTAEASAKRACTRCEAVMCVLCLPKHPCRGSPARRLDVPVPPTPGADWIPEPAAPAEMTEDEAFFRGLTRLVPEFVRNCCWCGTTEGVSVGPDPYNEDVNNDHTPVSMCRWCRIERARDV